MIWASGCGDAHSYSTPRRMSKRQDLLFDLEEHWRLWYRIIPIGGIPADGSPR